MREDDGYDVDLIPVKLPYQLWTVEVESKSDLKGIPSGTDHLVKIIIRSSKIQTQDWAHLNVVKTVTAKTDTEAALAHFEELQAGAQVEISSDEFFTAWLDNQSKPQELKDRALALRKRLLAGVGQ